MPSEHTFSRRLTTTPVRRIKGWLHRCDKNQLVELFTSRPDLATTGSLPPPENLEELARRCLSISSLTRCLAGLNRSQRDVLEALAVATDLSGASALSSSAGTVDSATIRHLLAVPDSASPDVDQVLDELSWVLLIFAQSPSYDSAQQHWMLPAEVRQAIGPHPAGLATEVSAPELNELPATARSLLTQARTVRATTLSEIDEQSGSDPADGSADQAELISELYRLRIHPVRSQRTATALIHRLRNLGLVRTPAGTQQVIFPARYGLALTGGTLINREFRATPVTPPLQQISPDELATATVTEVSTLLEHLQLVLDADMVREGLPEVKAGGLSVRGFRALQTEIAAQARLSESRLHFLLQLAATACLLTRDRDHSRWTLTPLGHGFRGLPPERRWVWLIRCWLQSTGPALTRRTDRALSSDATQEDQGRWRRIFFRAAAELSSPQTTRSPRRILPVLATRMSWLAGEDPFTPLSRPIAEVIDDAVALGLLCAGALTQPGQLIAHDRFLQALATLRDLLPETADTVRILPDHTLITTAPPSPELAVILARWAKVESSGYATVYRIKEQTVRAGLDTGASHHELLQFLEQVSEDPIPETLTRLIVETTTDYQRIRLGSAGSWIRCRYPEELDVLLNSPRADRLAAQRLSDTVAVSSLTAHQLHRALTELGLTVPPPQASSGSSTAEGQTTHTVLDDYAELARYVDAELAEAGLCRTADDRRHQHQLAEYLTQADTADHTDSALTSATTPLSRDTEQAVSVSVIRLAAERGIPMLVTYTDQSGHLQQHFLRSPRLRHGAVVETAEPQGQSDPTPPIPLFRILSAEPPEANDVDPDDPM
ncbi:helicase-associated domain-containing protein [Auritidibacter ignavus]|uniref:helicase-associated domain-containing protein n=1 Tax=Auritidibacter ignavus TaxID=678932 RepID=UPI000F016070|nr:helicase-associated domain-containing protein [Auritidibacter ignavus]NIH71892.1 hypothetical protein [Auritidibacter ignavus]RMX22718.1 hypothetical protein DYI20_08335 [Auritidibacter ignavus]WGH85000.1 helicase-associated domain-containing protein [Auritidibacter ignavus]WGH86103.1 helicase-associated domain-containing protein [Auritidibacter ignavus]WGH88387.1 helicase-associated domain-containing protein [Auritidibacter ignavus]